MAVMSVDFRRRALLTTAAGTALAAAAPAWAQFRIEITGVGATQVPITVVDFRDEGAAGLGIAAVVRADLQRSGLFRLVEPGALPVPMDERSLPALADWKGRGADALVAGSVTRLADGRFDVRYKLWDAVRGEELLGQSQPWCWPATCAWPRTAWPTRSTRSWSANAGVFSTRIAYVVRRAALCAARHRRRWRRRQVALASPEPIISPAWSPDGKRLAYVSFESQKAVVWVQDLAAAAAQAGQLPRLQQRAGLVARRAERGAGAVARRADAAVRMPAPAARRSA
jgi:TolB protein